MDEQRDRQLARRIRRIDQLEGLRVAHALQPADMRPELAVVEQRDALRRDEAAARVGRVRIGNRQKVGEDRDQIEQSHDDKAERRRACAAGSATT